MAKTYRNEMGYGVQEVELRDIPENPEAVKNKYNMTFWYLYKLDAEFGIFALWCENGKVNPASIGVYPYKDFPDWGAHD